jgi:hypothetical protein
LRKPTSSNFILGSESEARVIDALGNLLIECVDNVGFRRETVTVRRRMSMDEGKAAKAQEDECCVFAKHECSWAVLEERVQFYDE